MDYFGCQTPSLCSAREPREPSSAPNPSTNRNTFEASVTEVFALQNSARPSENRAERREKRFWAGWELRSHRVGMENRDGTWPGTVSQCPSANVGYQSCPPQGAAPRWGFRGFHCLREGPVSPGPPHSGMLCPAWP